MRVRKTGAASSQWTWLSTTRETSLDFTAGPSPTERVSTLHRATCVSVTSGIPRATIVRHERRPPRVGPVGFSLRGDAGCRPQQAEPRLLAQRSPALARECTCGRRPLAW